MIANTEKPHWSFYPLWIILTAFCVPIAFFIELGILKIITRIAGDFIYVNGVRHITEDYLFMFLFIPLIGLLTGLVQYGLLRRFLPHMGWWVFATIGGWFLGVLLIVMSNWLFWRVESITLDMALLLMGLAIGIGQWLLLRRRLPRASWWIGANIVGWGLSALITPGNTLSQYALFTLGSIPACVTAMMFATLIVQVKPTQPNYV